MEIEKQKFDELSSNQSKAVEQARSEVRIISSGMTAYQEMNF